MSAHPLTLAALRAGYAAGATVEDVVRGALAALAADVAPAVLIGEPLVQHALRDAERLRGVDPAALALYGVPFVVKDNIDVAGLPTSAGCASAAVLAEADAPVVARLRAAGAIVVGKANLDQFATGLVGTRSPFGTPRNVLDERLVPGGSSSGSAVAVALGAVAFSLGTDTAGSGRVPAALNRIVGLKPTRGRLSGTGVVPAVRRFDCVSVFASTVADAALVTDVAAGFDPDDPFSRTGEPPLGPVGAVGVPDGWARHPSLTNAARTAFEADLERLATLGHELRPVPFETLFEAGDLLYGGPLVAERQVAVGHLLDGRDDLDPTVAGIIAGASRWTAADAYRGEHRLAALARRAGEVWREVDALAMPTVGEAPFVDDVRADPVGVNVRLGRWTTFVNLLDLAAVVVPSVGGGPFGLQLVGPAWSDDLLASLAAACAGEPDGPRGRSGHQLVVVGAHLRGEPLNHQLVERGGRFVASTSTAPRYRLHALAGTSPPKPGLERVASGGARIEVEVWALPSTEVGRFLAQVPPPLCIGSVELADGSWCQGFLCEPAALADAVDITDHRGWRAYLAHTAGR